MNEAQALQLLDSIAAQTQMPRNAHDAALQAARILARSLQELAELRQRVDQQQLQDESP